MREPSGKTRVGAIVWLSAAAIAIAAVAILSVSHAQLLALAWPMFQHGVAHTGQSTVNTSAIGPYARFGREAETSGPAFKAPPASAPRASAAHNHPPHINFAKLPLSFEPNLGQSDPQVKFLSRGPGYSLFLTSTEAVLARRQPDKKTGAESPRAPGRAQPGVKAAHRVEASVLRVKLVGANGNARSEGVAPLAGRSNYLIGNDPKKWRTNVPTFGEVAYRNVYPGIDLIYYGTDQRQLEYDFIVAPGADPKSIGLGFAGQQGLKLDAHGDLIVHTAGGDVVERAPVVYQQIDGRRRTLRAKFALTGDHRVSFQVAAYDRRQPLVIDPALVYSTYLGGSVGDGGTGIAVDASGDAYVTGGTSSTNFPVTAGAFQTTLGGRYRNAFVAKLNPAGTALVYSTYLGGSGSGSNIDGDVGLGIAVDASGDAYVTGGTWSADFPITAGAFQTTYGDIFVTELNPTGSSLIYSTYLGDSAGAQANGIAIDASGDAYVTGLVWTADFPITAGAFQTTYGDIFVTELNPTGSALVYSTYLGTSDEYGGTGIAVDASGDAYVTGQTYSTNFQVTPGAFQTTNKSGYEDSSAFITEFNPSGSALVYSTYLGGIGENGGYGIAVDASGDAYVTGFTSSFGFPVTAGAFQTTLGNIHGGTADNAFVTELNPTGSSLVYSTYLGGSGNTNQELGDTGKGIAIDASGDAYVTGYTYSTNFPVTPGAFQTTLAPGTPNTFNAFVTELNPKLSGRLSLVYSTYLGGSGSLNFDVSGDGGTGIAVDASGDAYVTGSAESANFPTTADAFQTILAGPLNAFVSKLIPTAFPTVTATATTTATATATQPATATATSTAPTRTATPSKTATPTPSRTATATATKTATPSATPTPNGSDLPATLAFGSEVAGQTSATIKTVTVTSRSKAPLTIYSVTPSSTDGSATAEFNVTGGSCGSAGYPYIVGPSPDTCTITVSFTPSAISSTNGRTGTLTIVDDAPTGTQTIKMEGTGTTDVVTAPASVTIKNQHFAETVTRYVRVTNKQSQQITLTPSITQSASGFALAGGGTCGGAILAPTVPAASSCTIAYTYLPSALTPPGESATLTITASPDLATSPHTVVITATTVPDTVAAVAAVGLATNGGPPVTADVLKVTDLASPTFGIGALGVSVGSPYNGGSNNNSADFSVNSTPGTCPVGTAANVTCYPVTFTATAGTTSSHVTESACIDVAVASDPGIYANACAGGTNAPGVHTVKITGIGK